MHLGMLLVAAVLVTLIRVVALHSQPSLAYGSVLAHFAVPPLVLLMTAIAIVAMGGQGEMLGIAVGQGSYGLAWFFLGLSLVLLGKRLLQTGQTLLKLQDCPPLTLENEPLRLLAIAFPYSAQMGFGTSQLVVSQGLLELLDNEHLRAVVAHEKAHAHYGDSFWFFWWGWLRQLTFWLPYSESLWQELLLLREMRADQWAITQQGLDPLILAEALTQVAQAVHRQNFAEPSWELAMPFHQHQQRFLVRINGLIEPGRSAGLVRSYGRLHLLALFSLTLIPLIFLPLHYG